VSKDVPKSMSADLPCAFHPRRVCVDGQGLVYVGSGCGAADCGVPARRTVGSLTVWNVHDSATA